ncbi:MAG TPA: hypothetical protein VGR92_06045 [Steroidobacteraceae bacterium]|nr:hypothetical protein [Steroidobacteraceae bacterium]
MPPVYTLVSSLAKSLAWPLVVLVLAITFRRQIAELSRRAKLIKAAGALIKFEARDGKMVTDLKIVHETEGCRLYENGVFVQNVKMTIPAEQTSRQVTYPLTFPNEILSVQIIGYVDAWVTELNQGNLTLWFDPAHEAREIELVLSGV